MGLSELSALSRTRELRRPWCKVGIRRVRTTRTFHSTHQIRARMKQRTLASRLEEGFVIRFFREVEMTKLLQRAFEKVVTS
ncbi:protein of unknown function [Candidatus Methylomirabilis oxygeniifera]|uniref:Uncharacterized protein n=1 Tax=Methylomirabilis oxygeniifera TaxID=671143 RepID=D5MN76_METO1|nr:protein of unknown function [Candidatus Methylomirabilis oxyfera]